MFGSSGKTLVLYTMGPGGPGMPGRPRFPRLRS